MAYCEIDSRIKSQKIRVSLSARTRGGTNRDRRRTARGRRRSPLALPELTRQRGSATSPQFLLAGAGPRGCGILERDARAPSADRPPVAGRGRPGPAGPASLRAPDRAVRSGVDIRRVAQDPSEVLDPGLARDPGPSPHRTATRTAVPRALLCGRRAEAWRQRRASFASTSGSRGGIPLPLSGSVTSPCRRTRLCPNSKLSLDVTR